jgi:hypothetical protein
VVVACTTTPAPSATKSAGKIFGNVSISYASTSY